jgi:hypothetical protein
MIQDTAKVFMFIEQKTDGGWVRVTRFSRPMHPAYAKDQMRILKKFHPGTEYRLVNEPEEDSDIPF